MQPPPSQQQPSINTHKNKKRKRRHSQSSTQSKVNQLMEQRRSLPIYEGTHLLFSFSSMDIAKDAIVREIKAHASTIIVGETGSGKTTQIPQFLMEAGLAQHGGIAVTQPRRVAATTIAARVAQEVGTTLGDKVGYSVRFDEKSSPHTKIRFVTDGMLLREVLSDPQLMRYSVIILDEAHERTLRTDILFGLVKKIQKERQATERPLKIVVMSATLDAERFAEAKIVYVSGRQYSVTIKNTVEPQADLLDAALVTTFQIHLDHKPGDILIFMCGQDDIERLEALIKEHAKQLPKEKSKLLPLPLYAALPPEQQQLVFQPTEPGTRKVILSTNIAETSVTIPGIRYVVDNGLCKMRLVDLKHGFESLLPQPISKSSARQRTGRAGREAPGVCFRLYTEDSFAELVEDTEPEIKRCHLANVVLMLKAANIDDITAFDFLDPPNRTTLLRSLEQLYALGALDDGGHITALGRNMAEFPLEPTLAKILFQSVHYECTSEIIDLISLLSVDGIFVTPREDKREAAHEAKSKFISADGDHLTMLNALDAYRGRGQESHHDWCKAHFISGRNMKHVLDVCKQLRQICSRVRIDTSLTSRPSHAEPVLRCLLSGYFQHAAVLHPDGKYRTILMGDRKEVAVHPMSVLFSKRMEAILYHEMVFTTRLYARNVSKIQLDWLPEAAPHYLGRLSSKG